MGDWFHDTLQIPKSKDAQVRYLKVYNSAYIQLSASEDSQLQIKNTVLKHI